MGVRTDDLLALDLLATTLDSWLLLYLILAIVLDSTVGFLLATLGRGLLLGLTIDTSLSLANLLILGLRRSGLALPAVVDLRLRGSFFTFTGLSGSGAEKVAERRVVVGGLALDGGPHLLEGAGCVAGQSGEEVEVVLILFSMQPKLL